MVDNSTQITYWHKMAQLFHSEQLQLAEIVKFCIIATSLGIIKGNPNVVAIGVNVLDNRVLNGALIYGILKAYPVETISYPTIGKMLNIHTNTVGRAVKKLIKDGHISKEDYGAAGSAYKIENEWNLPVWVFKFTEAIVELHNDEELLAATIEDNSRIEFRRGMQVLSDEITKTIYRRDKKENDS